MPSVDDANRAGRLLSFSSEDRILMVARCFVQGHVNVRGPKWLRNSLWAHEVDAQRVSLCLCPLLKQLQKPVNLD